MKTKVCFVDVCPNTSENSKKYFILVQNKSKMFYPMWWRAVNYKKNSNSAEEVYCCEDHFDMEEDCRNWTYVKLMGFPIKFKPHIVPHKYILEPPPSSAALNPATQNNVTNNSSYEHNQTEKPADVLTEVLIEQEEEYLNNISTTAGECEIIEVIDDEYSDTNTYKPRQNKPENLLPKPTTKEVPNDIAPTKKKLKKVLQKSEPSKKLKEGEQKSEPSKKKEAEQKSEPSKKRKGAEQKSESSVSKKKKIIKKKLQNNTTTVLEGDPVPIDIIIKLYRELSSIPTPQCKCSSNKKLGFKKPILIKPVEINNPL